ITHFSFNFVDPSGRAKDNSWIVPTLFETERYIHEAVSYILENGLTFRLERVPLCYMNGFERFSTEVRMPAFDEKRLTYFAQTGEDENLNIEEKSNYHKTEACNNCFLNQLCPGLNPNYVRIHGDKEIFPVFTDPESIVQGMKSTKTDLHVENSAKKDSFEENVHNDLKLFKKSIELKSNKNNIYDTYSFYLMKCIGFKDKAFIYKAWDMFMDKVRAGKEPNLLSLYIHFPYCQSNCDYCIYPSTELKDKQQIEDYLDYIINDMELFSPLFKGIKFKCLSIGGGTPSLMSADQLKRLLGKIFKYFEFDEFGEKSIEFNPNTTNYEKLKVVDDFNFNKLSVGVQSLSPRVLKIIKRSYQRADKIKETIANFKKTNIGFMNVDLLLGLRGDTPEDFLYTYEEICKMQPNLICIYPLKANDKYIGARYGTTKRFLEFYYPLFDAVTKNIPEIAEKHRYTHYDDPSKLSYVHPFAFSWKDQGPRDVKYPYSNFKVEPYSTLGFGYYAESCINNMIRYTCVDKEHPTTLFLKKFSTDKNDFTYSSHLFYPHYDKVKFIVHSVYEHFAVSREKYKKMYGRDIVDDFSYAIDALQYLKIITVTEKKIIFNVKDEKETYPYLLFFVGREIVFEKIRT
ncbi:MAG: radical SAM protein, partial [Candidatus Heimdallarchaeota archaeon]|nr:radical SAM protein [Candidatus Heimdallarchaeota archaeon]